MITEHNIICSDNYSIAATLYESANAKGTIIIASAIGIKQKYYARLASFLSENNFHVITFDYRSTGGSNNSDSSIELKLSDWGEKDIEAVITFSEGKCVPIYFIGHSVGGQILGLSKSSEKLTKIIFIASSAPYWRRWEFPYNIKILLASKIIFPFISAIKEKFPTKLFGLGNQNIPSVFIRQWAEWMTKPDYLFNIKFNLNLSWYKSITQEILSIGFKDDTLAPENNIKELLVFYPNSNSTIKLINPKDINESKVGHAGFFNEKFKPTLWKDTLSWLSN